ncbi:hypothetical protein [Sphingobacterium pedocola]|nr:hypothetical protein [Sphingobacterium pedocola]
MYYSLHKKAYLPPVYIILLGLMAIACHPPQANEKIDNTTSSLVDSSILHFIPTMQHRVPVDRNAVYAASLPLAWNVLRTEINASAAIKTDMHSLALLDSVSTRIDALDDADYQRKVERVGSGISVATRQKIDLTFSPSFDDLSGKLLFDSVPVTAFGTSKEQNAIHPHQVEVLVYRSDEHFAVRLNPAEQDHEILLFKADRSFDDFAQMYKVLLEECERGEKEQIDPTQQWRYQLTDVDELLIPTVGFDKRTIYAQFAGQIFGVQQAEYTVEEVSQSVAFVMNKYGVSMETGAEIIVSMGGVPMDDMPKPKMLRFDKPFYIMMKKSDKVSPYLVVYIANTLLLEKGER